MSFLTAFHAVMLKHVEDMAVEDCDAFTQIQKAYEDYTILSEADILTCLQETTDEAMEVCIPDIVKFLNDRAKLKPTKKSYSRAKPTPMDTDGSPAAAAAPVVQAPVAPVAQDAAAPVNAPAAPVVQAATSTPATPVVAPVDPATPVAAQDPAVVPAPPAPAAPAKIKNNNIFMRMIPLVLKQNTAIAGFTNVTGQEVTPVNGFKTTGKAYAICQEFGLLEKFVGTPRTFNQFVLEFHADLPAKTPLPTLSAIVEGFLSRAESDTLVRAFLQLTDLPAVKTKRKATEGAAAPPAKKVKSKAAAAAAAAPGSTVNEQGLRTALQQIATIIQSVIGGGGGVGATV